MDQDIQAIQCLFPNYKVKTHLGNGAFASVYLAIEQLTDIQVAIKKINCFGMCDYQKNSSINQAKILSSLSCDNIIKLKACHFDEEQDNLYLVMQYADGGDLGQVINSHIDQRKRVPQDLIWKWVGQLANALQYMHGHRILHRDIKPGNIFLTKSKDIKIGDMNISRFLENGFAAVTKVGSPYYISPQVWIGNGYNQKCDIWSLGIVTYQLCCHEVPFQNHEIGNFTKGKLSKRQLIIPTLYSQELKDLISKMLEVNPETRLSSAQVKQICFMRNRKTQSLFQSVNSLMMDTLPTKKPNSKIILNHKPVKPEKVHHQQSNGKTILNSAYFHKKVHGDYGFRAKSTKCITPERKQNRIKNSSKIFQQQQQRICVHLPEKHKKLQVHYPEKKSNGHEKNTKKIYIRSQSTKSKLANSKVSCKNRVSSPFCEKRIRITHKQSKNTEKEAKKQQYSIYYR